jgi:hypothetical protein
LPAPPTGEKSIATAEAEDATAKTENAIQIESARAQVRMNSPLPKVRIAGLPLYTDPHGMSGIFTRGASSNLDLERGLPSADGRSGDLKIRQFRRRSALNARCPTTALR